MHRAATGACSFLKDALLLKTMPTTSSTSTPPASRSASSPEPGDAGLRGGLRSGLFSQLLAALVFFLSLGVTYGLWQNAHTEALKDLQADFDFRHRETVERIERRMGTYEQVLRGTKGFLGGSTDVDQQRFRDYVDTLRLERNYPGIQGIAIAQLVPPAERDRHVAAIRAQGIDAYAIRPDGERDIVTSISHIEPLTGLNPRALGFDMYTEPIRRAAMMRATDTGDAALSGKVTLIQEA